MNENVKGPQSDVIDLSELFLILRKYLAVILIATLIGAFGAYYYTKNYITPLYNVKASVIVDYNTNETDEIDIGQSGNSVKLASLYSVIAKSDVVLQQVLDELDSNLTYEQLKNSISVITVDDTQVVELSMTSADPDYAKLVITTFIECSNKTISEQVKSSSVMYLNTAAVSNNGYPVSPNKRKNTMTGALAGFVLSAGIFILKEFLNNKIKSEKEIVAALDVPMLGSIPLINVKDFEKNKDKDESDSKEKSNTENESKSKKTHSHKRKRSSSAIKEIYSMFDDNAPSYYTEAYKVLATNIEFLSKSKNCKNIVITSAVENEGKTNCSVNLALALASYGKKVCLVDCDLRRPSLHHLHRHSVGLTNVFNNECTLDEALYEYDFTEQSMDILFAGKLSSKPTALLSSEKMGEIVSQLSERYDYVIYDTPPCLSMTDSSLVGRYMDAAILVVKSDSTHKKILVNAKKNLEKAGVSLVGSILNQYKISSDVSNYYYYYSYYSHYGKTTEY